MDKSLSGGISIKVEDDNFTLEVSREKGCSVYTARYQSLTSITEDGEILREAGANTKIGRAHV